MAETATVKVRTSTRDLLREIGAVRHQSADQVITAALESMRHDERRRLAAEEARAIREDPDDLAEVAAVQAHMAALREGSGPPADRTRVRARDVVVRGGR